MPNPTTQPVDTTTPDPTPYVGNIAGAIQGFKQAGSPQDQLPAIKNLLQANYDRLNSQGYFSSGDQQQLGHILRGEWGVTDPTQGGAVKPVVAQSPSSIPSTPPQSLDSPNALQYVGNIQSTIAAYKTAGSPVIQDPVINQVLQANYNKLASMGYLSSGQGQQLGHILRGEWGVQDPTQGGVVAPYAANGVANSAKSALGSYCGPDGCANFVTNQLKGSGLPFTPTSSAAGMEQGLLQNGWQRIPASQAIPGDVIGTVGTGPSGRHVGIYVGNGQMYADPGKSSGYRATIQGVPQAGTWAYRAPVNIHAQEPNPVSGQAALPVQQSGSTTQPLSGGTQAYQPTTPLHPSVDLNNPQTTPADINENGYLHNQNLKQLVGLPPDATDAQLNNQLYTKGQNLRRQLGLSPTSSDADVNAAIPAYNEKQNEQKYLYNQNLRQQLGLSPTATDEQLNNRLYAKGQNVRRQLGLSPTSSDAQVNAAIPAYNEKQKSLQSEMIASTKGIQNTNDMDDWMLNQGTNAPVGDTAYFAPNAPQNPDAPPHPNESWYTPVWNGIKNFGSATEGFMSLPLTFLTVGENRVMHAFGIHNSQMDQSEQTMVNDAKTYTQFQEPFQGLMGILSLPLQALVPAGKHIVEGLNSAGILGNKDTLVQQAQNAPGFRTQTDNLLGPMLTQGIVPDYFKNQNNAQILQDTKGMTDAQIRNYAAGLVNGDAYGANPNSPDVQQMYQNILNVRAHPAPIPIGRNVGNELENHTGSAVLNTFMAAATLLGAFHGFSPLEGAESFGGEEPSVNPRSGQLSGAPVGVKARTVPTESPVAPKSVPTVSDALRQSSQEYQLLATQSTDPNAQASALHISASLANTADFVKDITNPQEAVIAAAHHIQANDPDTTFAMEKLAGKTDEQAHATVQAAPFTTKQVAQSTGVATPNIPTEVPKGLMDPSNAPLRPGEGNPPVSATTKDVPTEAPANAGASSVSGPKPASPDSAVPIVQPVGSNVPPIEAAPASPVENVGPATGKGGQPDGGVPPKLPEPEDNPAKPKDDNENGEGNEQGSAGPDPNSFDGLKRRAVETYTKHLEENDEGSNLGTQPSESGTGEPESKGDSDKVAGFKAQLDKLDEGDVPGLVNLLLDKTREMPDNVQGLMDSFKALIPHDLLVKVLSVAGDEFGRFGKGDWTLLGPRAGFRGLVKNWQSVADTYKYGPAYNEFMGNAALHEGEEALTQGPKSGLLKTPVRAHAAVSEAFDRYAYERQLRNIASEIAKEEKLTGQAAADRINKIVAGPTEEVKAKAAAQARDDLGKNENSLVKLLNKPKGRYAMQRNVVGRILLDPTKEMLGTGGRLLDNVLACCPREQGLKLFQKIHPEASGADFDAFRGNVMRRGVRSLGIAGAGFIANKLGLTVAKGQNGSHKSYLKLGKIRVPLDDLGGPGILLDLGTTASYEIGGLGSGKPPSADERREQNIDHTREIRNELGMGLIPGYDASKFAFHVGASAYSALSPSPKAVVRGASSKAPVGSKPSVAVKSKANVAVKSIKTGNPRVINSPLRLPSAIHTGPPYDVQSELNQYYRQQANQSNLTPAQRQRMQILAGRGPFQSMTPRSL